MRSASKSWETLRLVTAGLTLCGVLVGCSPITRSYGYTPSELDLAELTVGSDTKESVALSIGSPSNASMTDQNTWYYFSSLHRTNGAFTPQEVERQIVAISFTESGSLANVERFGLQDGQVVTLSRRVTNPAVRNSTFLRQLFDSLGNIPTDQFL